ncbi:MAG TPA: hypothetical protein VH744_03035 [Terriglobales bacterium]|jgi:transposase
MPRYQLGLEEAQRVTLEQMRDHHAKAYLRERAAALLKIADGMSIQQVAAQGLLKRRQRETVGLWVQRYVQSGLGGLYLQPGRGRKAAFSPSAAGSGERGGSARVRHQP